MITFVDICKYPHSYIYIICKLEIACCILTGGLSLSLSWCSFLCIRRRFASASHEFHAIRFRPFIYLYLNTYSIYTVENNRDMFRDMKWSASKGCVWTHMWIKAWMKFNLKHFPLPQNIEYALSNIFVRLYIRFGEIRGWSIVCFLRFMSFKYICQGIFFVRVCYIFGILVFYFYVGIMRVRLLLNYGSQALGQQFYGRLYCCSRGGGVWICPTSNWFRRANRLQKRAINWAINEDIVKY